MLVPDDVAGECQYQPARGINSTPAGCCAVLCIPGTEGLDGTT